MFSVSVRNLGFEICYTVYESDALLLSLEEICYTLIFILLTLSFGV
jgi:hypothetical protein